MRFAAAISQGFRICLKVDAILARQKLHRVAATKIARVNGPLEWLRNGGEMSLKVFKETSKRSKGENK